MTDLIPDDAYVPYDPECALGGWSEMLAAIDELSDMTGATGREVATVKYAGRLLAKGFGPYPWDTRAATEVIWTMGRTEEEMDRMPGVRHLERIAHRMLPLLPLAVRPEGEMAGICEIAVADTGAMACIFADEGPEITLSFKRLGREWHVALCLDWEIDVPISDIVTLDLGERFAARLKSAGSWPAMAHVEDDRIYATVDPAMFERLSPG